MIDMTNKGIELPEVQDLWQPLLGGLLPPQDFVLNSEVLLFAPSEPFYDFSWPPSPDPQQCTPPRHHQILLRK